MKGLKYLRKLKKGTKALEPCPVCGDELYFSDSITQKIAIVDDDGGVDGTLSTPQPPDHPCAGRK